MVFREATAAISDGLSTKLVHGFWGFNLEETFRRILSVYLNNESTLTPESTGAMVANASLHVICTCFIFRGKDRDLHAIWGAPSSTRSTLLRGPSFFLERGKG